jgi:hypothetical protein
LGAVIRGTRLRIAVVLPKLSRHIQLMASIITRKALGQVQSNPRKRSDKMIEMLNVLKEAE